MTLFQRHLPQDKERTLSILRKFWCRNSREEINKDTKCKKERVLNLSTYKNNSSSKLRNLGKFHSPLFMIQTSKELKVISKPKAVFGSKMKRSNLKVNRPSNQPKTISSQNSLSKLKNKLSKNRLINISKAGNYYIWWSKLVMT